MDADLTLEKDRARLSRNNRQWSEEQKARLQMSTTSIVTNSNVSTAEREPSSSADPFLFHKDRSKSLLKRRACDVGNRPPTDTLSAQQAKPLVASVGRRAITKLCADQPNPLG